MGLTKGQQQRVVCVCVTPIGVGHALFVLSDDQLTRIFHSANNALCCAFTNCVCDVVGACVRPLGTQGRVGDVFAGPIRVPIAFCR